MSASRERKKRMELEQSKSAAAQQPKQKKKISEGWILAIILVLIVAALFVFIFAREGWKRNQTVLTVGEHEVSVTEFNYFYNSIASNYLTYAGYLGSSYGVDPSIPLDQTKVTTTSLNLINMMGMYGVSIDTSYLDGFTANNGTYDVTLAQLFADNAKTQIISCYVTYDDAQANGYVLDEECYAEIDAAIENLKASGKENGWSLSKTIKNTFGEGCTKDGYYDYLVLTHTASHYIETLSYSAEEISARYDESPEHYDVASFCYYTVTASDFVEAGDDGTKPEATSAEVAQAKLAAQEMEKNFELDNEDRTVNVAADYTAEGIKNLCGEEASQWVFDEATTADSVKLFEKEGTYYVLKLMDKEDYALFNVLQIYVPKDAEGAELAAGEFSEAKKLENIAAGLTSDASAENFKALAEKYTSEGTEIEVEGLSRAGLNNVNKDVCLWMMDAERAVGDYEKFEVSGGTLYLMFAGVNEDTCKDASVTSDLAAEWLEESVEAAKAVCNYSEENAMYGHVGLALNMAG